MYDPRNSQVPLCTACLEVLGQMDYTRVAAPTTRTQLVRISEKRGNPLWLVVENALRADTESVVTGPVLRLLHPKTCLRITLGTGMTARRGLSTHTYSQLDLVPHPRKLNICSCIT